MRVSKSVLLLVIVGALAACTTTGGGGKVGAGSSVFDQNKKADRGDDGGSDR